MGTVIQAVTIVILNAVYCKIAVCMVDYENYRTDYEWENALVNRVFLFQFLNSYFALFYTAFIKGRVGDIFGYDDSCKDKAGVKSDSCMYELDSLMLSTLLTV